MNNILVVKNLIPNDADGGWDFRIWHLLEKGNADLIYFEDKQISRNTGKEITNKLSWRTETKLQASTPIKRIKKQDIFPQLVLKKNQEPAEVRKQYIDNYLLEHPDTLILASGYDVGMLLCDYFPERLIFEACDSVGFYYYRRFQNLSWSQIIKKLNAYVFSSVYGKIEKYLSQKAKLYLVPSDFDQDWILSLNNQANVVSIGNGTPWLEQPIIDKNDRQSTNPVVAFHGNLAWGPNRTTIKYLLEEILPLIQTEIPDVRLRIAGSKFPEELNSFKNHPNVEIYGFVDDIREWLKECDVYLMPMLDGSGVKNKLIESMAAGLTVVTNSLGAEALADDAKESIIVADGEQDISQAVIQQLKHPEKSGELGLKARTMAEKYFRWEAFSQEFMGELNKISRT